MKGPQLSLALLTPGATVERHGPELLTLCAELDRLGWCALAMDVKRPARYRVTIGERRQCEPVVHTERERNAHGLSTGVAHGYPPPG